MSIAGGLRRPECGSLCLLVVYCLQGTGTTGRRRRMLEDDNIITSPNTTTAWNNATSKCHDYIIIIMPS
jgi:hypothetical protein